MSKKKVQKNKKPESRKTEFESSILALLDGANGKAYSFKQIVQKIGLKKKDDIKIAGQVLDAMLEQERISQTNAGNYKSSRTQQELTGIVDHVSSRFAYVRIGQDRADIYVKGTDLGSAVDGDTVSLKLLHGRHGEHEEGRVTKVIKRNRERFVGKVEVSKNFAFVVPDHRKMHTDFFIYPENINNAKTGDKVVIEVTSWATPDKKPEAKVVEVLGKAGEHEAEIHSIMAEFGLPFRFPEDVAAASAKIPEGITDEEVARRRDFRTTTTFTIDPEDAKDFDDAISFKKLENGNYEIGVHIADVTHYVLPNTPVEKEAYDRATSVYLVDRTIPMLPERLSNELCSLRPNEDKLTSASAARFSLSEE